MEAVENAGWMYIEDAMTATEKAIDNAYWDGLDPTPKERELEGLRMAQKVGEQYVTDW
jgi:hypothetical protein